MSNKGKPIGIFDSGLGGLTVLKEIMKKLPGEDLIYFGDSKRAPYGTKSRDAITKFAFQDAGFLMEKGVKALVVACNTVSSNSIDDLRNRFDIPVIEVIGPGARTGIGATSCGRIAVIGTEATISSGAYERKLRELDGDIEVIQKSCPLFVPIVEEGSFLWDSEISRLVASMYLEDIARSGADVLILGCTHYPLLKNAIRRVMGDKVRMVDSARSVAAELASMFGEGTPGDRRGTIEIYTSDSGGKFLSMCAEILERKDMPVMHVDIERY